MKKYNNSHFDSIVILMRNENQIIEPYVKSGLWVATSDSTINHWTLSNRILAGTETQEGPEPIIKDHDIAIRGGPSIKTYTVLNDKRRIVTKDTEENIAVYDVLKVNYVLIKLSIHLQSHINQ